MSTLWQLQQGWNQSNWAQTLLLHRQKRFFWEGGFLKGLPWRIPVLVEYIAWFLLPVALVAGLAAWRALRSKEARIEIEGESAPNAKGGLSQTRRLDVRPSLVDALSPLVLRDHEAARA
jgi:hypothetical protein